MAVSADGRTVATASWDGTVKLWHVGSGDLMLTLKPEGGAVWTVAFSPDGRMLAAGAGTTINRRRVLKIWHAASGADVSTDPTLLDQMNLRAWTLRQAGQLQEAAALRQQVVEGARASMSHGDPRRIRYQLDCSVLLTQTKQYEQSERLLLESQAALEESNADPALALRAAGQFAELYEAWGKPEKVAHYRARLPALRAATQPSAATQQSPANHVVGRVVSAADPQQRRSQAVAELLEKKLTLLGADCDTFYIRAAAHARRNEADQAKLWLAAGDQRVERHCVDVNRAKALRGEAIRAFEESGVALPPSSTKPAAQLSLYEEFIQAHPDAAWAYQLRGQSYDEMGETTKAEADYRRALESLARENGVALDDARQLENFAANATMRRQWELSLAAYGRLIESHLDKQPPTTRDQPATDKDNNAAGPAPDIGKMFASRGSVYLAMGDLDNAELNHSKALELTPRPPAGAPWDDYARIFLRRRTWPKTAMADEKLKFKRFADSYGAALRARVEATPDDHEAWYRLAPFLLWQDDVDGYRRACREMLERFESSDRPEVAERTAKTCSLAPGAVGDPTRLVKLADRALKGNESHAFYGFFQLCKGVAEHRAGNHAASIEWLERMGPTVDQRNPWHAIAYSVIAMSQHHLGQAEQARASLGRARAVLAIDAQRPGQGDWFDWLHCEILFREAEELLGK
jgi:tetratricopeptide (TPR) repeat protein